MFIQNHDKCDKTMEKLSTSGKKNLQWLFQCWKCQITASLNTFACKHLICSEISSRIVKSVMVACLLPRFREKSHFKQARHSSQQNSCSCSFGQVTPTGEALGKTTISQQSNLIGLQLRTVMSHGVWSGLGWIGFGFGVGCLDNWKLSALSSVCCNERAGSGLHS